MKTKNIPPPDPIWSNNVDILADEGCLPVIGSCQVSSIFLDLGATGEKAEIQQKSSNVDLTMLNSQETRIPQTSLKNNYVVLQTNGATSKKTTSVTNFKNSHADYEKMLYYVCDLCMFLCTSETKMIEHLEDAHKTKRIRKLLHLKCPACCNVFFHKMPLRSHLIHDHGVGNSDLNSIIQSIVFSANKEKNTEQVEGSSGGKKGVVKLERFADNKETVIKLVNLPKVEVLEMPQLEVTENNADKMLNSTMNQMRLEPERKVHKCAVPSCKIQLRNPDNLKYHVSCHKDNGFICLVCSEVFSFWKPLSSHLWRLHQIDMELFSCDKCDYKSVSLGKLNNIHKLIHGDVKGSICNICNKGFKNKKQLSNHKIIHKSQVKRRRFSCEVCSKNFSDKRQMKVHVNVVHKKIKPFQCSYCSYKGSSRSTLKLHIRQHTGEKPFACDSCSYSSSDHNSLRRHKLRHTGQKPYKCPYCSYASIQSSTYKMHLKTKHPTQEKDLMFACPDCQFRTVNKEMYESHMVAVHSTINAKQTDNKKQDSIK